MSVRKRIVVSGRVQGVFFRDSCRRFAQSRGVAGRATNLPDGRVEVIAEGPEEAVDALVEWCRSGPSYAEVTGIEVVNEDPEDLDGFAIS